MDDEGNHIGGIVGFLKSLGVAIRTFVPTRVIVVFDGKGGSQRRRKIFPMYKKSRKPPVRLNRSYDLTTDEQEAENLKYQLVTLVQLLESLPITIIALDNIEADDVIAYLSQLITLNNGNSIIYSTDKDFYQLASESVIIYNPVKKKTYDVSSILEEFGIHPAHFHFFRALDGDKSDNIDGVKGVGQASIRKYLPEITNPKESITLDFIRQKYSNVKKLPKMISNIINNEEIVNRNLKLMNLHEGIMSVDSKLKVSNLFYNSNNSLDKQTLTKLLKQYKLITAFPSYDLWITQNFLQLNRFYNDTASPRDSSRQSF
jgi:5'-3' exonuclease